ncbi:MAG: hypothetical protein ACTHY4_07100 [Flavobacteriaceae bacterium]
MKTKLITSLFVFAFLTFACQKETKKTEKKESKKEMKETKKAQKIKLTPFTVSEKFPDASLKLEGEEQISLKEGESTFKFNVKDYELGAQTNRNKIPQIANSDKGQHIHVIIDNEPYSAHYMPDVTKEFDKGEHVMLAFLSRSYHESVKNDNSFLVRKLKVGDVKEDQKVDIDFDAEHMFYSRPKGTYSGKDTDKILLDFFLVNTDLSDDGNKVLARINGEEFEITKWQAFMIEGLPMGENKIELQLVDNDDKPIEGPYNTVKRTITLEK